MLLVINYTEILPLNNRLFNKRGIIKIFDTATNNANCLTLITNNIKGIQTKSKRLSVVEYFRNKLDNKIIYFLQETNSNFNDENILKDNTNGSVFHSHCTSNSCGVLITYFKNLNFGLTNK